MSMNATLMSETPELDPLRWWALIIIAIAQLMVVLDASVVTVALPSIQGALHISEANRQWVMTAYTLAFGGLLLLGGRIADFMGRKKILIVGFLGFAAASAIGGASTNEAMLFAARALQGAFGAIMAPASLSLLSVTFVEAKERARAFGVYGAVAGGGAAIGLVAGGLLTQYADWRWCLFVNIPISIVAAVMAVKLVHESKVEGHPHFDIPGVVTSSVGLALLVYGLTEASITSWTATKTLALLAASVALLIAFVIIEVRTTHPLLPMRVVRNRNRGGSFFSNFLAGLALFGMFLFLTYYFQQVLGYSALKAGIAFLPFSGGIVLSAIIATEVLPRIGPRPMMVTGLVMACLGAIWLTQIGAHTTYVAHVLPSEIIMSVGLAQLFVPLSSTSLLGVEHRDAGVASGLLNATQQVGGSLGSALLNTIFTTTFAAYIALHGHSINSQLHGAIHAYSLGFLVTAIVLGVAAIFTFFMIKATRHDLHGASIGADIEGI